MASTMARTGSAKTTELIPSGTAGPGNATFLSVIEVLRSQLKSIEVNWMHLDEVI